MPLDHLTVRPLSGREDLDLFRSIPYVLNNELEGDLDAGRRRFDWLWVAVRADRLVGRVGWWARSADDQPLVMDILDVPDTDGGVRLVETAMRAVLPAGSTPPDYIRFLPPDWASDAALVRDVDTRRAVLERLGARPLVERLRLQWDAGGPVPEPNGRLRFRAVADRAELVGLMTSVLEGTLDAHSRAELTRMTPVEQADFQYDDELARYTTPREWWRVATLPDGTPVGFVIPARNAYNRDHRVHRGAAGVPRQGIHRRRSRRGHADPRRTRRSAHPGRDRCRQRADGTRLRAGRLRHVRTPTRHDLELSARAG